MAHRLLEPGRRRNYIGSCGREKSHKRGLDSLEKDVSVRYVSEGSTFVTHTHLTRLLCQHRCMNKLGFNMKFGGKEPSSVKYAAVEFCGFGKHS